MKKIVPLLLSVSWIIISVMVQLNPTGTLPMHRGRTEALLLQVLGALLIFILSSSANSAGGRRRFYGVLLASVFVCIVLATAAGYLIHRDYYSFYMPVFLAHAILFLTRIAQLGIIRNRVQTYRYLFYSAILLTILVFAWLIIVSYTIVVRVEPRWIEATWYNIVNAGFGFLLLWTASSLWEQRKRTVRMLGKRILVDDVDVTGSLTPQEVALLNIFIVSDSIALNCSRLLLYLRDRGEDPAEDDRSDNDGEIGTSTTETDMAASCTECLEHNYPPSKCASYRNLKNRVSDIKKYLELLQIGTIIPVSEKPREIKEKGWRFRFFDDVRLEKEKQSFCGEQALRKKEAAAL